MWALSPAERLFLRMGLTPDFFNFAGLFCGLASGILIGLGRLEWGGLAIALGGVADIFDGRIARARKLASPYGTFIDSTLDRFVEVFAFLGFVVLPAGLALRAADRHRRPGRLAPGELHARPRRVAGRDVQGGADAARGAPRADLPGLHGRRAGHRGRGLGAGHRWSWACSR